MKLMKTYVTLYLKGTLCLSETFGRIIGHRISHGKTHLT